VKISQQLRSAAIGILVIGSSSLVSVYLNSLGNDSKVVNLSGIVRGGTQRLVKLELAAQPSDKLIDKQDKLVNGLINGDLTLGLPAATDPEFRDRMLLVATAWQDLKQKIVTVRKNSQTKADLLDASEKYFELADRAVFAAEKYSTDKAERLRVIQLAVFAVSLLLLITIWITVNKITSILENSTSNIATSYNQISSVVGEQEKSINQQALTMTKTTKLIGGLKDLSQQSNVTAEMSIDRVNQIVEIIKKANETAKRNSAGMYSLQEKINTISTHIDLLEKQAVKIAKVAIAPERSIEFNTSTNRQVGITNTVARNNINTETITKLFNNLQSSIAAMTVVTNDSAKIIEVEVTSAQQNTSDLRQAMNTIDYLSLNSQQVFTTSKQYTSAIQQVMTLMDLLNVDVQDTTKSISQIRLSSSQLGETTAALKTKI
jgi:methyl-accepting chemotaxis protein